MDRSLYFRYAVGNMHLTWRKEGNEYWALEPEVFDLININKVQASLLYKKMVESKSVKEIVVELGLKESNADEVIDEFFEKCRKLRLI